VLAMVQARLEALPPEARRVMRAGSTFGEAFWKGGVRALLGDPWGSVSALEAELSALVDRELIVRRSESKFPDEEEYAFRHALVREAAYGMLLAGDRALGHRIAGEWLLMKGEKDVLVLAEHFELGGEPARAAIFYQRAAAQALDANDLEAVIARGERAVRCGAEGRLLGEVRRLQTDAHTWRNDLVEAERCGVEAMRLLPRDEPPWFSAAGRVAVCAWERGDMARFKEVVDEICRPAPAPRVRAARFMAMALVVTYFLRAAMYEAAEPLFDELSRVPMEMRFEPKLSGQLHAIFGWRAIFSGDAAASSLAFESAAANFEQAGDIRTSAVVQANAAITRLYLGQYAEAELGLKKTVELAERMGLLGLLSKAKTNLGYALAHRGALEEARRLEEEAVAAFSAQRDRRFECGARMYLSEILLRVGELEAAEQEAQRTVDICDKDPPYRCWALASLGKARLARGHLREALTAAEEAMRLLDELGIIEEGDALARGVFAEALFANGEQARAREAIASAKERLLARAAKIGDPAIRRSFLENVPENARTLALAEAWGR